MVNYEIIGFHAAPDTHAGICTRRNGGRHIFSICAAAVVAVVR